MKLKIELFLSKLSPLISYIKTVYAETRQGVIKARDKYFPPRQPDPRPRHPLYIMTGKEINDLLHSWRFPILFLLIGFACLSSIYISLSRFSEAVKGAAGEEALYFLRLFTVSNESELSFIGIVSLLGPVLGIFLGFDAINSEQNKGTLSRLLSQPVYRDYIIVSKFIASLTVISLLFVVLTMVIFGWGLVMVGVPPSLDELLRLLCFTILNIVYVAFWLNLSIFFSVRFRQATTSALSGMSVFLFFSIFYRMIIDLIMRAITPKQITSEAQLAAVQNFFLELMRFNPSYMFSEATGVLLTPEARIRFFTDEQARGAIPTSLPLEQSLLMIWTHVTVLLAGSILLFALGYISFMRREIRSR